MLRCDICGLGCAQAVEPRPGSGGQLQPISNHTGIGIERAALPGQAHRHSTTVPALSRVQPMTYLTFEDSVLDHADHNGNLSHGDAQALLSQHGFTLADTYADNHGVSWCHLDERNAQALLAWLGY